MHTDAFVRADDCDGGGGDYKLPARECAVCCSSSSFVLQSMYSSVCARPDGANTQEHADIAGARGWHTIASWMQQTAGEEESVGRATGS